MAKVNISPKKKNPLFVEEAGDYLIANGYIASDGVLNPNTTYYFKQGKGVVVFGDKVEFLLHHDEEPMQRLEGYQRYMSFEGISELEIFDWMLLLHIADIVPLRQFIKGVIKEGVNVTADEILGPLFKHFKVTDDREAVIENY